MYLSQAVFNDNIFIEITDAGWLVCGTYDELRTGRVQAISSTTYGPFLRGLAKSRYVLVFRGGSYICNPKQLQE
jgi:hypothetical protein